MTQIDNITNPALTTGGVRFAPLRSVGDDATSYQGNQQRYVIALAYPDRTLIL